MKPDNIIPSAEESPVEQPDKADELGLMTPAEVAAILKVDGNTVARWSDRGMLRAVRTPGGHRRYFASDVLTMARRPRRHEA